MRDFFVEDGEPYVIVSEANDGMLIIPDVADAGLINTEMADENVSIEIGRRYPEYTGPTEITPTEETQTLSTEQKSGLSRIVVNPIPRNYGLITWDGRKLTVS